MRLRASACRLAALGVLLAAGAAVGQGTFQNLDFESARVPFVPSGQYGNDVLVSDGAPGWAVYIGGGQFTSMLHNNLSLGGAAVAILGPEW